MTDAERTPFNGLSPAQAERLAVLLEELGEAQQVIGKVLRHGYESRHPNGEISNRQLLEDEIGDVFAAVSMLTVRRELSSAAIQSARREKLVRVIEFLHHHDGRTR